MRAANVDANQPEVTRALRQIGATVQLLHTVGKGCPDLVAGFRGINVLLELKNGAKKASAQKLTAMERDWHAAWNGQVAVVSTPEEAVDAVLRAAGMIA